MAAPGGTGVSRSVHRGHRRGKPGEAATRLVGPARNTCRWPAYRPKRPSCGCARTSNPASSSRRTRTPPAEASSSRASISYAERRAGRRPAGRPWQFRPCSRARRSCRGAAGSGRVALTEHQVLRPSPRDRGAILEPVPEHAADHKPTAEGADRVRHPRPGRGDVPVRPHRRVHARSPPAGGHTPTEIYETPATPEVAGFIGRCNLLEGRVDSTEGQTVQVELGKTGQRLRVAGVCSAGSSATVGLRSERITLTDRADAPHDGAVNVL